MNRSFFRKVGFGLSVDEDLPKDAVNWATSQVKAVPDLNWKGPIYSLEEMMNFQKVAIVSKWFAPSGHRF